MHYSLTDPATLKLLLRRVGITPQRSSGQHFLICPEVVEATLLALTDAPLRVTELGSGAGALTAALLDSGFTVRALERDTSLAQLLTSALPAAQRSRLTLTVSDLRHEEWHWDEPYCLVGNIPYNLSGYIVRRLVHLDPAPERVVLLVQREVGERMVASPPAMSLLGLTVQLWGTGDLILHVPRSCFWPQPRVDSCLVLITPHHTYPLSEREQILDVARRLFQAKRKQLGGSLARLFQLSSDQVSRLLSPLGILPVQRPQELSCAQWQKLVHALVSDHLLS